MTGTPPDIVEVWPDGTISKEEWQFDGKPHRLDGPARKTYDEHGQLDFEWWFQSGFLHR